jgi:hypothetical protein
LGFIGVYSHGQRVHWLKGLKIFPWQGVKG